MIGFAVAFLSWAAATIIPAFVGLMSISGAKRLVDPKYLAAFAFGIFLWFFVDTISGSATLDVNSGFGGGFAQLGVVTLFLVGVIAFFTFDRNRNIFSAELSMGKYGITIPLLVAAAVGIHGFGEGWDFGGTAFSTTSTSLIDAFGGISAGVAYVLHKGLEPMMIGACYAVYTKGQLRTATKWVRDMFVLGIVFVFTSLVGAAAGYFISMDTTYLFALGTGTSIYAAIRLVGPLFSPYQYQAAASREAVGVAVALLLGFIAIYIAALFHS